MLASDLINLIARTFNVPTEHLLGFRRDRVMMRARMAAYAVFRARGASLSQIGSRLNRDRTTVKHGLTQAEEYMRRDPVYRQTVENLIKAQARVNIGEPTHDN